MRFLLMMRKLIPRSLMHGMINWRFHHVWVSHPRQILFRSIEVKLLYFSVVECRFKHECPPRGDSGDVEITNMLRI